MLRPFRSLLPRQRESLVALINAAFLLLVVSLMTVARPSLGAAIDPMATSATESSAPLDALFVTSGGELRHRGRTTEAAAFLEKLRANRTAEDEIEVKLAADRNLSAARLVEIVSELRQAGAARVSIVTELAAK